MGCMAADNETMDEEEEEEEAAVVRADDEEDADKADAPETAETARGEAGVSSPKDGNGSSGVFENVPRILRK